MAAVVVGVAGLALAPLLPGATQAAKAHLQGHRGSGALQPYRELARLWRRGAVDPAGAGPVFRAAPVVVAAAIALALLMTPVGASGAAWPGGGDALALVGLLATARVALALSAWDVGAGFGLMGAARDLMFAILGEALLLLVVLLAAAPAGGTGLGDMWAAASGTSVWGEPAHWCGAVAMAVVLLLETGRQPIDNPDTHLELTMVHEGPLLEYAGRDLGLLVWASAARHWVALVLAAGLFLPHPGTPWAGLLVVGAWVAALTGALAVVESTQAKMRLLRVPAATLAAIAVALVGVVALAAGTQL